MANNTLSSMSGALKDTFMLEGITDSLMSSTVGLAQLTKKQRKNFQFGDHGEASIKVMSGGAAQFLGAGASTLPTPKAMSAQKVSVSPSYLYGAVSFTDKLLKQAASGSAAFANAVESVKADALQTIKYAMSTAYYNDNLGNISDITNTTVGGTAAAYTINVDNPNSFYEGMIIDVVTSAGGDVSNAVDIQVIKVNKRDSQITVDAASSFTLTSGDFIVFSNSYNNSLRGLNYLLNDATYSQTYFGLSRTTYPTLALDLSLSGASAAAPKDFTIYDLWELLDLPTEQGPASTGPDLLLTTKENKRKIGQLLMPSRRFNSIDLEGGYRATELDNDGQKAGYIADPRCPKGNVFALNTPSFELFEQSMLDWMEVVSGGGIFRLGTTTTIYEGFPSWMAQLYCTNPRLNARAKNWA